MESLYINIPKNVENIQLPAPELLTYYKELERRIFWLDSEIDDYSLEIARQILIWNREDEGEALENRKPIKLLFSSPGGSLNISNTLIDAVEMSITPIWGFNLGQCASGAAFIYLACHKKFMTPRSFFLFHKGSGEFAGSFNEVCAQLEDYQTQIQGLVDFVVKHTDYTQDEVEDKIMNEWFVYSQEAIEKKICDEIITDVSKLI